ncbi:MAG: hypothetical protein Q8S31_07655 [Alphaproteobacteria bacterium]|nr:hypothetical protein [Alphaproteobacteria bacterium]
MSLYTTIFLSCMFFFVLPFFMSCIFDQKNRLKTIISFGLMPPILGLIVYYLFSLLPGKETYFYLNSILLIFIFALLGFFLKRKKITFEREIYAGILLFVIFFVMLLGLPLYENDALEYANMANIFFRDKSFSIYPFVEADPITGFYTPIRHPLGYPSLLVFQLLIGFKVELAVKFTNAYYIVLFVFLISKYVGRYGILYILSVPLFIYVFSTCQIDVYRIFLFILSICILSEFFERKQSIFWTSLTLGLTLLAHSISVLCLMFIGFGFVYMPKKEWWKLAIVCIGSILIGGEVYIKNFLEFGKIVTDTNPVWELDNINEKADLAFRRRIDTTFNWILFGLLQGFTKIHFFGIHFYLAFYAIIKNGFKKRSILYTMSCFGVFLFFLIIVFSGNLGAKNPRYFLTIIPLLFFIYQPVISNSLRNIYIVFTLFSLYGFKFFSNWSTYSINDPIHQHVSKKFFDQLNVLKLDGKVLAFEQELFVFYGKSKILKDLDPVMIDFYKMNTKENALKFLEKNDIKYIYLSPYMPATFYNSYIGEIAGNPTYSKLLIDESGYRLFKIDKIKMISPVVELKNNLIIEDVNNIFFKNIYQKNQIYNFKYIDNYDSNYDVCMNLEFDGNGFAEIYVGDVSYGRVGVLKKKNFYLQFKQKNGLDHLTISTYKNTLMNKHSILYCKHD